MAGQASWSVSAEWMSGKTWTLQASPASAVGKLWRRMMLASGSMRRTDLLLGGVLLDRGDSNQLCNFQGFEDGA